MTWKSGSLVLTPMGPRLGECEASVMAPEVKAFIRSKSRVLKSLVLDLSRVEVISSYGLGLCIELRNFARSLRAETVLAGASHDIREVFRIMKLDRMFHISLSELPPPAEPEAG